MVLPNLLIVGAPKSATTTVSMNLGRHPDVFMAPSEVHFFSVDTNWRKGTEWYEAHFDQASGERVIGEKTPNYLHDPRVPQRIMEAIPNADSCTYLVILREPVARALSDAEHRHRRGVEPRLPVQALLDNLADREGHHLYDYLGVGRYAEHIERYIDRFGRGQVHVEFYEDVVDDPAAVYRRILARVGLSGLEGIDVGLRVNESARLRHPMIYRFLALARAGHWLPPAMGARTWAWLIEPQAYEPMPIALEQELRAYYGEPNSALAELLGRPLPDAWQGGSRGTAAAS